MDTLPVTAARPWLTWAGRVVSIAALLVVLWACLTAWGAVTHGNPAYAILLALTALVAAWALWHSLTRRKRRTGWRLARRIVLLVLAVVWVALMWWLRPFTAVEPALEAMKSDSEVTVNETSTQIVMTPTGTVSPLGVFFQPGAKVEARAYAAVLRPLAESGYTVVIPKQPLGIAFLSVGAFDSARGAYPDVDQWVVAGHSLGGTVAAIEVENQTTYPDGRPPAVGLMFFASYPASDMSADEVSVLSISGSLDGLSTPAKIDASKADLPADSTFTQIEGAVHSQFGDYGTQPGDGVPTISNDDARSQISAEALYYLEMLASGPLP